MSQFLRQLHRDMRYLEERCVSDGMLPLLAVLSCERGGQPVTAVAPIGTGATVSGVAALLRRILADIDAGEVVEVPGDAPLVAVPRSARPAPAAPAWESGGGV